MFLRKIISLFKTQVKIDESSMQHYQYSLKRRTLLYFLCIVIVSCVVLWLVNWFYFQIGPIALFSLSLSIFLFIMALIFGLKGKIRISYCLTMVTLLGLMIINMLEINGIHHAGIMGIPIFILIGSIFFRKIIVWFFALISIFSIVLVAILEINGYIKTPFTFYVINDTIVYIILIIAFAYITWVVLFNSEQMIHTIEKKVKELEAVMEELAAQNEELEAQNEELIVAHNECVGNEHKLRKSLNEKEVLLKEVHHRVKNNMQIICSLISLQCDEIDNKEACEILNSCKYRIHSMSLIHEKLYESNDLAIIDLNLYLNELIKEYERIEDFFNDITIKLDINNIFLTIDHAIPLGLIINELVMNSIKHAFKKQDSGDIEIKGNKEEKDYLIVVKDNGKGISKDFDIDKIETLGLKLVHILIKQINGEIKVKAGKGTQFFIRFPGL